MADDPKWRTADRISDKIIDILNEEKNRPGALSLQLLAGQMLALVSFMRTAPDQNRPPEFTVALLALELCLKGMQQEALKP